MLETTHLLSFLLKVARLLDVLISAGIELKFWAAVYLKLLFARDFLEPNSTP